MDVSVILDIATRLGVPMALLTIVLWYHARVVQSKDQELARINDLRVKESQGHTDRLLQQNQEFMELMGETDKTLQLLTERVK